MNGDSTFLGIVRNERFEVLEPQSAAGEPARLTRIPMQAAQTPEGQEIPLAEWEGCAILVAGHHSGAWIFSAEILEKAGPLSTTVDDQRTRDDIATLRDINLTIPIKENEGDLEWLTDAIAPEFAFRRANGTLAGGAEYLKGVKPPNRTDRVPDAEPMIIKPHGNRAVVSCIVTMGGQKYHNLRLFVRMEVKKGDQTVSEWKLLGWANEEV